MWKYFDIKLLNKLLILGVLSFGLAVALFISTSQTRANLVCCDLCEPNYNACLGTCGVDDKCPELCAEARFFCELSCNLC
jgi:hypothetical protein